MSQNGNVACFAEGYISGIYGNRFQGGTWTGTEWTSYAYLGGEVTENASCISQSQGLAGMRRHLRQRQRLLRERVEQRLGGTGPGRDG
jgi:hypothetical protein